MKNIVLFPGLAADHRLFSCLRIESPAVQIINYITPRKNETLQNYARNIAATIPAHDHTIFIGVSFGGILAQEVAHFYTVKKIILISSISSIKQLTIAHTFFKIFPVYEWLSAQSLKKLIVWISHRFTKKNISENALFENMIADADIRFIRWGIRETLHWKQVSPNLRVIHVHGTKDRLFPIVKIPVQHSVEDGQHFMVVQKSAEISLLLEQLID
ncbi:MAG: hypothetical protein WBB36_12165 [Chitinophagales bacterium]